MSGLEIAGVVLGGIPIIILCLNGYEQVAEVSRIFRGSARLAKRLCGDLENERLILSDTCEKALSGILQPGQLKSMLTNPGTGWKDSIGIALSSFPGGSETYNAFTNTVNRISEIVEEIRKLIGIDSKGNVEIPISRRVSFYAKRHLLSSMVKELRDKNTQLRELVLGRIELARQRRSRSQNRLFELARELFRDLQGCLRSALGCGCSQQHGVALHLPRYPPCKDENEEQVISQVLFTFIVSFYTDFRYNPQVAWHWEEIDIGLRHVNEVHSVSSPGTRKTVRFTPTLNSQISGGRIRTGVSTCSSSPAKPGEFIPPPICAQTPTRITNLCRVITDAQQRKANSQFHGYITDLTKKAGKTNLFDVYTFGVPLKTQQTTVSLRDVLAGNGKCLPMLSFRHRVALAPLIASSIIQLSNSWWAPAPITSQDILFIRKDDSTMYDSVYFSAVCRANIDISITQWLIALGTILTELTLGHPFDKVQSEHLQGTAASHDCVWDDWYTRSSVLQRVNMEAGPESYEVVRRCVLCQFGTPVLDMDDPTFRQKLYDMVVQPLEENIDPGWSGAKG